MANFANKNILIVGATAGIGAEIYNQLTAQGANVYTIARRPLPENEAQHLQLDLSADFQLAESQLPATLHGIVYCAGSINLKPFNRFSEADFLQDYKINFLSAARILQTAMRALKNAQGASVVLFSTVAVQTGFGFHASISAAKGAVEGLTRTLAAEWALSKIRVNAIAPSLTDTPLAANLLSTPEKREASNKRHPLNRVGTASELASAAVFLLSEQSSWTTGQILHIDGGMSSVKM
jgi:3-oxoacyl-[acyl-carrier protein] reductase